MIEQIRQIAQNVQLADVVLLSFSGERIDNPSQQAALPDEENPLELALDWASNGIEINGGLAVQARFEVSTKSSHGLPGVNLKAHFGLWYPIKNLDQANYQPDHIEAFAQLNGIYNAWPYWRAWVQGMSIQMGVRLVIPVYLPGMQPSQREESSAQTPVEEHVKLEKTRRRKSAKK